METAERMTVPQPRERRVVVTSLIRGGQPETRSAHAERALLRTVAEWQPGGGLDIRLSSTRSGRVAAEFRPLGSAPADWDADVAGVLTGVAAISRRATQSPQAAGVTRLAELVRDPARARLSDDDARSGEWHGPAAPPVAWPLPARDASVDILGALHSVPGAFVRVLVAPPTAMERAMVFDETVATWDRLAHPDFDAYLGSPVLIRTFVGMRDDISGFARFRGVARGWGTGLVLRDADAGERARFDTLDVDAVAGHVRPEGWALALLRLPAAGERPANGIPSHFAPAAERPLQPVPKRTPRAVVLGSARTALGGRVAVTLEPGDLCRHASIEGASGSGKTTFLATLISQLSAQGIGCTLIEHHGTGVDQALRTMDAAVADRAITVRHGDPQAPAVLNLFDEEDPDVREQIFAEFTELVQAIFDPRGEGIVGPRWRRWFTLLCDGVSAAFGREATLLHLLAVASEPARARKLAIAVAATDRDLAHRIDTEIGSLKGEEASNLPAWAVSKFQPMVGQRAMREILGRPRDSIDVTRVMDESRTLLVDLGGPKLGVGSARMLGAIWLLKHWVAMGRRADRSRPHVMIIDEAHLLTFGALPAMLAEARKFGVGVWIAGQSSEAYAPALQSAIEANAGSFFHFRLGLNTAGRGSVRLGGWPAHELLRLPDLQAAATLSRAGVTSEPFLLKVTRPPESPAALQRAQAVDARCAARWRAASLEPVVTDAAVDRALEARVETGRPRAPRHPAPDTSAVRDSSSFLDEWLARQAGQDRVPEVPAHADPAPVDRW
ncbi:hypothetical protein [Microbacterium sp. P5_E9]